MSLLRTEWDRSFQALSDALTMYREKHHHRGEFATIVIDEPTTCFPRALSMPETQSKLARIILADLAWLGVHHGCDKQTARVIYASSSAAVESLSMCLISFHYKTISRSWLLFRFRGSLAIEFSLSLSFCDLLCCYCLSQGLLGLALVVLLSEPDAES